MVYSFSMGIMSIICSTLLIIWSTEIITNVEDLVWFAGGYGQKLWWFLPQQCWWSFLAGKGLSVLLIHEGMDGLIYFGFGLCICFPFFLYTTRSEKKRRNYKSKKFDALRPIVTAAIKDASTS